MDSVECIFCLTKPEFYVVFPCNHFEICFHCFIRNIKCYNTFSCYFCQQSSKKLPLVTSSPQKGYLDKSDFHFFEHEYFLYQDHKVIESYNEFFSFKCPKCRFSTNSQSDITYHVKVHQLKVCFVCLNNHRELPCDFQTFAKNQLDSHYTQHPKCLCCDFHAYDQSQLNKHMIDNHSRCEICIKKNIIKWFKNSVDLVRHFEQEHYICHHPICSSENLIAFETRIELMLHLKEVHNEILEIEIDSFQPEEPQDDSNPKARRTENDQKFVQQMSTILTKAQINEFRTKGRAFFSNSISVVEFYKVFDALFKERKNQMFTLMLASMPGGNQRKVLNRFHIDAVSGGIEYAQKRFEDQENFRQPPRVDPPPAVLEAPSHSVHEPLPEPPPASPARQEVTPPAPKKKKKNRGFVVVDF